MKYKQVLLDTAEGLFSVSVADSVPVDDRNRILNPRDVFDEGSTIVAVEQGVLAAGKYTEMPAVPSELLEASAKSSGNGGGELGPKHVRSDGPRFGTFILRFRDTGEVTLRESPVLGQLT
jgi:hypothetical protein